MPTKQELKDISRIFASIHLSTSIALSRGAAERKRVLDELDAGKIPSSYRYDWLKKTTEDLIERMAHTAQDFNKAYVFDRCSVQDLVDVLEAAITRLRKP